MIHSLQWENEDCWVAQHDRHMEYITCMKTLDATLAAHMELSTLSVANISDLQTRTFTAATSLAQELAVTVQSEFRDALASSAAISMALSKQLDNIAVVVQDLYLFAPSPIPSDSSILTTFANTTASMLDSLQDMCNMVSYQLDATI